MLSLCDELHLYCQSCALKFMVGVISGTLIGECKHKNCSINIQLNKDAINDHIDVLRQSKKPKSGAGIKK